MTVADGDGFVIVDGFHRYFVSSDPDVSKRTGGLIPVVVLDKPLAERMASTVRHNRARGKHVIEGMSGHCLRDAQGGVFGCRDLHVSRDGGLMSWFG